MKFLHNIIDTIIVLCLSVMGYGEVYEAQAPLCHDTLSRHPFPRNCLVPKNLAIAR